MLSTLIAFSMPIWLQIAAFPGILVALCCAMFIWELHRRSGVRRQHLASHREMDDAEFIRRAGLVPLTAEGEAACRIRGAIAKIMHVPPATLHPSDELGYIAAFGFDTLDFIEIAWAIEKALDIRIPQRHWETFFKGAHNDGFDALIRFLFDEHYLSPDSSAPPAAAPAPSAAAPAALPLAEPAPAGPSDPTPTEHSAPPIPAH